MVGVSVGIVMPALPLLATSMGVTTTQFGLINSSFALAKVLTSIPSGVLVDTMGRRLPLATGAAICGVGYLAFGFASSFEQMMMARFVAGVGAAFMMAGSTTAV